MLWSVILPYGDRDRSKSVIGVITILIEIHCNRLIIYWLNELHFFFAIKPKSSIKRKKIEFFVLKDTRHIFLNL